MRERRGRGWSLVTRVRANYGATYFYIDWAVTRRHWQRALLIAKRRGLTHRYVHGLIDVAFLDLLEDRDGPAERGLEEALGLCHDYGFENSELRCLLNLGCLALTRGDFQQALELLREADSLGFRHRIGRRLWRVRANMATAYFALGDVGASLATDRITLNSMPPLGDDSPLLDERHLFASTRLILALANIALRAESSKGHRGLLQSLPQRAQASARELAQGVIRNELERLPGLRGRHCKRVGRGRFFLITE
jgi:tetratricopeptide (TPR) repeat protein